MYYVLYLRKSRADLDAEARGEGETLARHRTTLMQLAARNGHVIAREYAEVVSGETIASRPQMQRLLMDIADPECAGVYVMEVERLARGDTMDQGRVAQAFLYSGTRIITPTKTYDPANEFDQEYFEFGLFMSRREYKTINRRIQAGRMQSVKEGKYICSRPAYGYRKVKIPNDKGYTLHIHPQEADVVRQVFRWYVDEGLGITRIANRLKDLGVPVGEQGGGWAPCRIHRMLSNEVYIGMIRWGRVRTHKQLAPDGVHKSLRQSQDYELHPGLHEAIITREQFDAAQAILHGRRVPMRSDMQQSNPLAGIVRCKLCGHFMRGLSASGRQPAKIYCPTHGCPTVRSYRQPVEDAILDALRGWLDQYALGLDPFADLRPAASQDDRSLLTESLAHQQAERDALLKQKSSLHDLLERGVYDLDTFQERLESIQLRLRQADARIAEAQRQLADSAPIYCDIETLAPCVRHILDVYESADAAGRCALLKQAISVVDYQKTARGMRGVSPNTFRLDVYPRVVSFDSN